MTHACSLRRRKPVSGFEQPGAFQCTILRALELPKAHREVFLLKDIQGHKLTEIAAILGISIDAARARLNRARREIGHLGDSDAMGRAQ
jgi:DNA-directed RNA polymerase specialized sigma24 family protein